MLPHPVQTILYNIGEYLSPVLKESNFESTGVLTPDEFVAAGDFLVYKCPTWAWEIGDLDTCRPFLPRQKQFLMTRNVPCFKRASSNVSNSKNPSVMIKDDEWVLGDSIPERREYKELSPMICPDEATSKEDMVDTDPSTILVTPEDMHDKVMNSQYLSCITHPDHAPDSEMRRYDISITYDKYYSVPRVWLFGYSEDGAPLVPLQLYQDISTEHATKTVTIDPHPYLPFACVSVHPCKHANVMKSMISILRQQQPFLGSDLQTPVQLSVHIYLVLFLKFISSVLPTIEYDCTMDI